MVMITDLAQTAPNSLILVYKLSQILRVYTLGLYGKMWKLRVMRYASDFFPIITYPIN